MGNFDSYKAAYTFSLNPYSNGSTTMGVYSNGDEIRYRVVLILILMEVPQWVCGVTTLTRAKPSES